jgi:uncharacterized membrane protein
MKKILLILIILTIGSLNSQYDVIIVRDDLPLDWIIAQAYSHKSGIPIVTTSPDQLSNDARDQLVGYRQAGLNKPLIFGGGQAISLDIEKELTEMGFITHRIREVDRYGTSAQVARELYVKSEGCVMVNGENYKNLLIAERIASESGYPLLFIRHNEVPASVKDAIRSLGVTKIILIDSEIGESIKSSLTSEGYSVELVRESADIKKFSPAEPLGIKYLYLCFGLILGIILSMGVIYYRRGQERVPYALLTEDEEKIIKAILENKGELTQDRLPEKTGFSRPRISRIVSELCERDMISKEPFGRTQKLTIKKEFYENRK